MADLLPADASGLDRAAAALRHGGLVAFPTETVYGLGADARSDIAVARLYAAKGRPRFNPLIAHLPSTAEAEARGAFTADARRLAAAFWPGPLTLVVPATPGCDVGLLARAGLTSVALRVPAHPFARALLEKAGMPVVAPSANPSGRVSPTSAAHVLADLGDRIDLVLDGGACSVGVESTIVACLDRPTLLRPGGVPAAAVEAVLGFALAEAQGDADQPLAPGRLASHYAPRARVRLNVTDVQPGEVVLDFGGRLAAADDGRLYRDLAPDGNVTMAATRLFAALREFDVTTATGIAVAPIPRNGLGAAINDRLGRAAAPRG